MDRLETLVGDTRTRLLRLLRSTPRPVAELADALGITPNAVRTHVAALERDGLVRAAADRRATGGKPARVYELTPQGEELFPKAYDVLLGELVRTLREEDGEEPAIERMRRVGRRLGAGHRADGDPAARVDAAAGLLRTIGASVTVVPEEDGWSIRADGCLFSSVVPDAPDVCAMAEALVGEVSGLSVRECCDRSGRPRCAFRVTPGPAAEA